MVGYYERRKSIAAEWCLRLALLSIPYFLLTVLMHRTATVTTPQMFWLVGFGLILVVGSLLLGMRAAVDLWEKGYKGGRSTVNGIVLSVLMATPFGIQFGYVLDKPQLHDVATNVFDPPQFIEQPGYEDLGPGQPYDNYRVRQMVSEYPELFARRYEAPPDRVAASVLDLMAARGWELVASRNLPQNSEPVPVTEDGELAGAASEIENIEAEPGVQIITVQTRAQTLVMKLPSDIVIRLSPEGDTTLVDMRASSGWGPHDFGINARFIQGFLEALDTSLAGLAGE